MMAEGSTKRPRQSARKNENSDSVDTAQQPVRMERPKVNAGPCPKNEGHQNTRVYDTKGRARYCVCDDCGVTWKKVGPYADALRQYAVDLANSLDGTRRQDRDGETAIMMLDRDARAIAAELRKLAAS